MHKITVDGKDDMIKVWDEDLRHDCRSGNRYAQWICRSIWGYASRYLARKEMSDIMPMQNRYQEELYDYSEQVEEFFNAYNRPWQIDWEWLELEDAQAWEAIEEDFLRPGFDMNDWEAVRDYLRKENISMYAMQNYLYEKGLLSEEVLDTMVELKLMKI